MSDTISIRKRTESLNVAPQFTNYSRVIINIDDNNQISVGDDTGRTFEIDNPLGTQEIAERILSRLRGYQYQPYEANGAMLDPAAEIGDGVTVNSVYGGIYKNDLSFSRMMRTDIAAPHEEEINHEYKYESPTERKFKREIGNVKATLMIQANEIRAEVAEKLDAEGGTQSFGWRLLADRWAVTSNGQEIFTVNKDGGTFTGKVVASSGKIGGFDITATAIRTYDSGNGIWLSSVPRERDNVVFQVGNGFFVTADGSLTANNGTFNGEVQAKNIQYGGNSGYMSGGGIAGGSIDTGQLSSYCARGVGGGVSYGYATVNGTSNYPTYFSAGNLRATNGLATGYINCTGNCTVSGRLYVEGSRASWQSKTINGTTIHYLGY